MEDSQDLEGSNRQGSCRPDERPKKRSKQVIACDQCQKRKSRCELITEKGCRRCVVLKTPCSLLPLTAEYAIPHSSQLADASRSTPPPSDSQRLQRIEEAIAELARLSRESAYSRKRPHAAIAADKGKGRADPASDVGSLDWAQLTLDTQAFSSVARLTNICMGLATSSEFRDPVELGIVSLMEMQFIYSKFKQDFARLLPVCNYLVGNSSETPSHPFLRSVILHHVAARAGRTAVLSHTQCLQTYECVQDNITTMQTTEPTRDILRALLILSYCPNRQHEPLFAAPDPFRAAVSAYDAARDLCLDLLPSRLSALKAADLEDEWTRTMLDDACLWYAIAHRYTWANLIKSIGVETGLTSDCYITHTLPASLARETGSNVLEHLFAESSLLEIIAPLVPVYRRYISNFAAPHNSIEYEEGQSRMEAAHSRFTIWRTDHRTSSLTSMEHLLTSSYYVQLCLSMKMSLAIGCLPKPLGPEFLTPLMMRAGQGLIAGTADLLERIAAININFDAIPHYFLSLTFLPLGLARSFNLVSMSSDKFVLTQNTLQSVGKRLRRAHPSIPALLPRFDTAVNLLDHNNTPTPSESSLNAHPTHPHAQNGSAPQPLPEILQGMLHSDFAAWPANLDPFGLGTMIWPGMDGMSQMDRIDEVSGLMPFTDSNV